MSDEITHLRMIRHLRAENDHLRQARSDALAGGDALREEIIRLRARVEVLEEVLHAIFPDGANINLVRKANAEEAKP
jgi:hypothetical protein